jgi:hypothetical protein
MQELQRPAAVSVSVQRARNRQKAVLQKAALSPSRPPATNQHVPLLLSLSNRRVFTDLLIRLAVGPTFGVTVRDFSRSMRFRIWGRSIRRELAARYMRYARECSSYRLLGCQLPNPSQFWIGPRREYDQLRQGRSGIRLSRFVHHGAHRGHNHVRHWFGTDPVVSGGFLQRYLSNAGDLI